MSGYNDIREHLSNTQQQTRSAKPARRQYAQQNPYDQSSEHAQLMSDAIGPAPVYNETQTGAAHGVPVYAPSVGSPYDDPLSAPIGQAYSTDFKTVHLETRALSRASEATEELPLPLMDDKMSLRDRYPGVFKVVQSISAFCLVGLVLAIPALVTYGASEAFEGDSATRQTRNLIFYISIMLINTWVIAGFAYVIAMILPYVFRFITHYVNPAHEKYWRVFSMMRMPIVVVLGVIGGYISLFIWFENNNNISAFVNILGSDDDGLNEASEDVAQAVNVMDQILTYFILWAGAYFLEKILVVYLTVHYHFRAHHHEILRSKKLVDALVALYDVSYSLYPLGHSQFRDEDWVIHRGQGTTTGKRSFGRTTAGFADMVTGNFAQGFGVVFGSESTSHWFSPRSSYAIVGRALRHPAASAALAKRIWVSLASENSDALTLNDIKEAVGPQKQRFAADYFQALDENENGDIRLNEIVPSIIEAGEKRQNIYTGMANISHVVNTLDWLMLGMLATIMLSLVLISQVPILSSVKDLIGFSAVGLSFIVGRTLNEFVQGAIFTMLDHPYDVGDLIEIYNLNENKMSRLLVTRISLLYTEFEEIGSGKAVQFGNMRSKIKKIVNLTRSGKNRETLNLCVDFGTTFKDLEMLKQELQLFITAPENCRDYYPDLGLRVSSLCDLAKLELRISFRHKSSWSNEALRAARSSRFHCAIVAAVRRVPINKPGGGKTGLGDEGKPMYTVMITDTEAAAKREADKQKQLTKRMDFVKPEAKPADEEEDSSALTAEEIRAAEEKAEAKAAKDAKDAQQKVEEAEAAIRMMGIKRDGISERNTGASTSIDLVALQQQYLFISGDEKGMRLGRRHV